MRILYLAAILVLSLRFVCICFLQRSPSEIPSNKDGGLFLHHVGLSSLKYSSASDRVRLLFCFFREKEA